MQKVVGIGRVLYAVAILFFGIQYLLYAAGRTWPIPGPPWSPASPIIAAISGTALMVAGVSLFTLIEARLAAPLLAAGLFLRVVFIHLPKLVANLHDPGPWTG